MTMYVDGVEVPGTVQRNGRSPCPRCGTRTHRLDHDTPYEPWLERLDEITVYDCSLDAGEVAFLMQRR